MSRTFCVAMIFIYSLQTDALFCFDCNCNGTEDVVDIASGTSQDKDGNGNPDECDSLDANPFINGDFEAGGICFGWTIFEHGNASVALIQKDGNHFAQLDVGEGPIKDTPCEFNTPTNNSSLSTMLFLQGSHTISLDFNIPLPKVPDPTEQDECARVVDFISIGFSIYTVHGWPDFSAGLGIHSNDKLSGSLVTVDNVLNKRWGISFDPLQFECLEACPLKVSNSINIPGWKNISFEISNEYFPWLPRSMIFKIEVSVNDSGADKSNFSASIDNVKMEPLKSCVKDPKEKAPVIILPGVMGSELNDAKTNELIWVNIDTAFKQHYDEWMLKLALNSSGTAPDENKRCAATPSMICRFGLECPFLLCAEGGREIKPGNITNVAGRFTAYKELGDFLARHGYELGKQLFLVSYDWRLDIKSDTVTDRIRSFIEEATKDTPGGKVNVIAHSQGGLVIRSYIQKYKADHRINKVVFLGTPHLGAIKIYSYLKGYNTISELLWSLVDMNLTMKTFIIRNFPSAYEVSPRFDFFRNNGVLESIQTTYSRLPNSQLVELAETLHEFLDNDYPEDIEFYAICGYGLKTEYELEKTGGNCVKPSWTLEGDGTVTIESAAGFGKTTNFYVREEHINLPANRAVQEKMLAIFNNGACVDIPGITIKPQASGKGISAKVCCPVNLKITDNKGNVLGIDSEGNLLGDITESDFYVFEDSQAAYMPHGSEYTVEIKAKDTGRFSLTLETVEANGSISKTQEYANIPISKTGKGKIILAPDILQPILSLDVNGDNAEDFGLIPGTEPPDELEDLFVERGNVNGDKIIDISDAVTILTNLFLGGPIACFNAADANSDKSTDISDPIYILSFLFIGGVEKPEGIVYCP